MPIACGTPRLRQARAASVRSVGDPELFAIEHAGELSRTRLAAHADQPALRHLRVPALRRTYSGGVCKPSPCNQAHSCMRAFGRVRPRLRSHPVATLVAVSSPDAPVFARPPDKIGAVCRSPSSLPFDLRHEYLINDGADGFCRGSEDPACIGVCFIRMPHRFFFLGMGTLLASTQLAAQWVHYPTVGVPRKADGKVNMAAPAPRMADGKSDFSGIWMTGEPNMPRPGGLSSPKETSSPRQPQNPSDNAGDQSNIRASRQMANIGIDLPGGLPYQPWLVPIVKKRTDNLAIDDPHIRCLPDNFIRAYGMPHLLKFVHTPSLLVMLNELNAGYRQVFTDARPLPEDPTPSWQGYSSAKWSGDTLVIDTIGLRDDTWIDWNGSVVTEAAKVREQIRRPDFGHLEVQVTVDDPKAYTKPWTVTLNQRIVVDTELIDEICLENEQSLQHLK